MIKPVPNCKTCHYENKCKKLRKCNLELSHYKPKKSIIKTLPKIEKFIESQLPYDSIRYLMTNFKIDYHTAKDYYWKWRREYMRSNEL